MNEPTSDIVGGHEQRKFTLPRIRFSLKTLLIGMTLAAVFMGMVAAPAMFVILLCLANVILSGCILIGILFGRGWIQAFSIGALVPHVVGWAFMSRSLGPSAEAFLIFLLLLFLTTFVSGVVGAAVHGFIVRREGKLPVPNLPVIRSLFSNGPEKEEASDQNPA